MNREGRVCANRPRTELLSVTFGRSARGVCPELRILSPAEEGASVALWQQPAVTVTVLGLPQIFQGFYGSGLTVSARGIVTCHGIETPVTATDSQAVRVYRGHCLGTYLERTVPVTHPNIT